RAPPVAARGARLNLGSCRTSTSPPSVPASLLRRAGWPKAGSAHARIPALPRQHRAARGAAGPRGAPGRRRRGGRRGARGGRRRARGRGAGEADRHRRPRRGRRLRGRLPGRGAAEAARPGQGGREPRRGRELPAAERPASGGVGAGAPAALQGVGGCCSRAGLDPDLEAEAGGDWPTLLAAQRDQADVVGLFLEARADPNRATTRHDGRTPVALAAEAGACGALRALLEARGDVSKCTASGESVALLAARQNRGEALRQLLEARACPTAEDSRWKQTGARWSRTLSPLLAAVEADGGTEALGVLLELAGRELDLGQGVATAVQGNRAGALGLLLEAGADPNEASGEGESHLAAAMKGGHLEVVRLLLQAGATVDAGSVFWAVGGERLDVLSLLLEARGDANAVRASGSQEACSAVFAAASRGSCGALRLLLEARGDANMLQPEGRLTPVLQAAAMSDASALRLLLEARGNVNETVFPREHSLTIQPGPLQLKLTNTTGRVTEVTPDGQAAERGVEPGWRLVSMDGEPYEQSMLQSMKARDEPYTVVFCEEEGVTPALIAARAGHAEVLAALREAGADIASAPPGGPSPVSAAAEGCHAEALCLLLEARGDPGLARAKAGSCGSKAASP
ncbi:unnamed protein product, partial [Prorocentrum cordatum]